MKEKVDWKNNILIQKELLRDDPDNIYCTGITAEEFANMMIKYLLGENWYVTDPLGEKQILYIAADNILDKYSKRYRDECDLYDKECKKLVKGLEDANMYHPNEKAYDLLKERLLQCKPELKKEKKDE